MIIKKYVDRTESEAVEAAKRELGDGVVIMNVKNVKQKGLMALFRSKQVEVTVALEENDNRRPVRREADAQWSRNSSPRGGFDVSVSGSAPREVGQTEDRASIEKKLDNLQSLLVSRFQQSEAERRELAGEEEGFLSDEESEEESEENMDGLTEQQRFMKLLYNTMLDSEVDEKYANQIMGEAEVSEQKNLPFDYILANVYQKMILKFGRAEGITVAENSPRIVIFMGPTGVGKTTTIAKIASHYVMEEKKKVALVTADTYRISAVEQLQTYASILEIPLSVIYSEEEAKDVIAGFANYDYIFVDTTGHSHQNEEQLERTRKLIEQLKESGECQAFLVLSATTKYRDLLRIVSCYDKITDYQLIFTKLDETDVMGNLLNLKLYTGTPIAFVTYGQNVPNDIEQFNPQKTVKQILGRRQEKNA